MILLLRFLNLFLEPILKKHIKSKNSSGVELRIEFTCSITNPSKSWDIFESPLQFNSNPVVNGLIFSEHNVKVTKLIC